MTYATFCACGELATANGRECGFHFRQRLLSIQVDYAKMDTSELHNYYDREAIAANFGENAKDQYMDETDGLGAAWSTPDGYMHIDRKTGEPTRLDPADLDRTYLAGDAEEAG